MRILPNPISFLWDEGNVDKNLKKHNVTVSEAEEMFLVEPFVTFEDEIHSTVTEKRYQGLGQTKTGRKLFVAFTLRDRRIRVISIRDMKKKERNNYEQFEKNLTFLKQRG